MDEELSLKTFFTTSSLKIMFLKYVRAASNRIWDYSFAICNIVSKLKFFPRKLNPYFPVKVYYEDKIAMDRRIKAAIGTFVDLI